VHCRMTGDDSSARLAPEGARAFSQSELGFPDSLIGLPTSEQRAAVTVAAGFVQTHEAPVAALREALLTFEVIAPFSEIEPDHSVTRAMSLRLSFIAKWAQGRGSRTGCTACDDQDRQQAGLE
jgi:hypothetical protein